MVQSAKNLCEDLIAKVKEEYEIFKSRPPRFGGRDGGYGGRDGGYRGRDEGGYRGRDDGGYGGHDRGHGGGGGGGYGSYNRYGSHDQGSTNSPAPPGVNSPNPNASADYAAQYAQYYGGQDPYAAYGGYAKYVSLHIHYPREPSRGTLFR